MNKLKLKQRKAEAKGVSVFKLDWMNEWGVYGEGWWCPEFGVGTKRDAINFAYHNTLQPKIKIKVVMG